MQTDPRLGIVQHLTVGEPATSPFARLFQFGMRSGMRTWAAGQDFWQGDAGPYWGHNAVVRIAPFRAHARLALLPDGRHILSHDQIEAALLRGAGWGVRVLVDEDGSFEAFPPVLPEHLRRELRWLAGNLQYVHLLRLNGLQPMGRWQLVQAILLFAGAPFCMLFLLGAATAAATDRTSAFPAGAALALTLAWAGALYAPKLLGYLEVQISRAKRARYGGTARFLVSVLDGAESFRSRRWLDRGRATGLAAHAAGDRGVRGVRLCRRTRGALGGPLRRRPATDGAIRCAHRQSAPGTMVSSPRHRRGARRDRTRRRR
jgi:membrane glycosyltransferase